MKLLIDSGKFAPSNGNGYVDYTKYVLDGSLTVEDSVNVPTITTFNLAATDNKFTVLARSCYVKIVSEVYAEPSGHLSAGQNPATFGKILATGFITDQPAPQFLGLNQGLPSQDYQQLSYTINVTSDEWLLNCQSIPYIPAFVSQTDSQILASIAEALMPGFFNTSLMASGTIIPYYQYDPTQTWSDIAKTFADQNRYYHQVKNKTIYYEPFGQVAAGLPPGLGIEYDETTQVERELYPIQMQTTIVSVPPVNDCIVIGDVEPQDNWDCYFIGDGFTSNFQLTHQVFQGTSSNLLEDDWTEAAFSTGTWVVNDPENTISLADSNGNAIGALNIVQKGTSQTYTPIQDATFIQAQNGLELAGGLNLQHGQFVFNDSASGGGVVGGIFQETTEYDPGHCLAGFKIQGQPSLGAFNVFQVAATGATMAIAFSLSGTNQTLQPGNVFEATGFVTATFVNGQNFFITSVVQNNGYYVITCTPQNPGILPANYGPTHDSGTITFGSNSTIVTASGAAGIYVYPLYNGSITGSPIVSQPNHQYVLQTWIGAEAPTRYTRSYTNLTRTATYGAQNLASFGTISWVVTDVNLGNYVVQEQDPLFGLFPSAPPPVVINFSMSGIELPPFVVYVLLSGLDLNLSINYTVLSIPPQGFLTVQSLTGNSGSNLPWLPSQLSPPITYQLGFGMINQTAQISLQGQAYELSFYTDDIPSVGARIRFQSWAAGQSIARVQDPIAILNEARVSGDSGIRSAIMSNLSPLPRTSAECEAAAAAAILDREYPQWQGSYTVESQPYNFENLFSPSIYGYPHTGLFFWINSPVRAVSGQNFFVNTVRIQVVELRGETLNISVDYGPDLYLEKLLPAFLESEQNLLVPTQTVPPPNPITLPEVLNASLATLDSAQVMSIVDSLTGNYIVVDLSGGTEPFPSKSNATLSSIGATGCEVRYVNSGWGNANQGRVGIFTVDQFTLPRTVRDQTFYLRGVNGNIFSRFSKALRVVYPLIPSNPTFVNGNADTIVLDYAGDVRDIYGLELRATPVSGAYLFVEFPNVPEDTFAQMIRSKLLVPTDAAAAGFPVVNNSNVVAIYNPPSNASGFPFPEEFLLGDIIYVVSPSDSSFQGIKLVTNQLTAQGSIAPVVPVALTFEGVRAFFFNQNSTCNGAFCYSSAVFPPGTETEPFNQVIAQSELNSIEFNYGAGVNWAIDPSTQPALFNNYDEGGNFLGTSAPWDGADQPWALAITGKLIVPKAGTYGLNMIHDDGAFIGIKGPGVTFTGTPVINVAAAIVAHGTCVAGIPIMGGTNESGYHPGDAWQVTFAASGVYQFEIDYAQWYNQQTLALLHNGGSIYPGSQFTAGVSGSPWGLGWFDYGQQYVDQIGISTYGVDSEIATCQLFNRGSSTPTLSGSIQAGGTGLCTIGTSSPHGFAKGQQIIIGCGWQTFPQTGYPNLPNSGAVFTGLQTVTNVIDAQTFQFVCAPLAAPITAWEIAASSLGVPAQFLNGLCAAMPTEFPFNLAAASGVIIQRPVFSPSDLVIDLTQPDIAETLAILQALSPNGRIQGLDAYFFNLQWDYSTPTPIPNFQVPAITGLLINDATQQVSWNIAQGIPDGYRIDITDAVTNQLLNQFTIDHPYNPISLTQFQMSNIDFTNARNITITPFDSIGDGIPLTIYHAGNGIVGGGLSYIIHQTVNGILQPNQVLCRVPFDQPVVYAQNLVPSQAWIDVPPVSGSNPPALTGSMVLSIQRFSSTDGSQDVGIEFACLTFVPGSHVGVYTSLSDEILNQGDVLKVIAQNQPGDGVGIGLTIVGTEQQP